jgi:deoxyxylulose-5-phosphate synthase
MMAGKDVPVVADHIRFGSGLRQAPYLESVPVISRGQLPMTSISQYSGHNVAILSSTLEKARRDNDSSIYVPDTLEWKGKRYSMAELYEHEEIVFHRNASGLQKGSQRDPGQSAIPSAADLITMVRMAINEDSGLAGATKGLTKAYGFLDFTRKPDEVSPTE